MIDDASDIITPLACGGKKEATAEVRLQGRDRGA
jgi:hypothetical protein